MADDLKRTLNLPETGFPMRADLVAREPRRLRHWENLGLYRRIQERRAGGPSFVLHDGPPFTNGDVHIGTALNKTLKDITLRYRSMRGYRTPYVPGWDCHGLPIEQKVMREVQASGTSASTAELRAKCDAFSESWITRQRTQFQRLGILADWEAEYRTKLPAYEADILRAFAAFIDQGLVYRAKKPVYWSIPFETALAEAEIEYADHTSPAIWVRFAVPGAEAAAHGLPADAPLSVLIWTTTPWTLPANLAIAVHPEVEYVLATIGTERVLVAAPLLPSVAAIAGHQGPPSILARAPGRSLEHLQARHPFIDRPSPVVLADYVTTDSGTGCVHTAPGHGLDDYLTGLRYGLEIYCPVGNDGRFVDDGRMPAQLVGLTTLESVEDLAKQRTSPANIAVLRLLDAQGALFARQKYRHSYPHCWRSKTPIVFRAVDQWFVGLDRTPPTLPEGAPSARAAALAEIDRVRWIPAWGANRIRGAVENRPDWCISRQRAWGVPIPAFYSRDGQAWIDARVARAVADRIATTGSNLWFEASAAGILAGVDLPQGWPAPADLIPGRDTLDVWFDSGSSHLAVLRAGTGGTSWPADLYLEGSDQHRGWFQSALWNSVVAAGGAPYRAVLTHGFIVGEDGRKLSKSGTYEKPPTSDNYVAQWGADVLRFWIASQDFRQDITISDRILQGASDAYRSIRNTLRFQLGNLHGFTPADRVPVAALDALDRWLLGELATLVREVTAAFEDYEFHRAIQLCNQFSAVTLSALYHDVTKDRLYTLATRDLRRRSTQTVLEITFSTLTRLLAPVLTFTADEAWSFAASGSEIADASIHLEDWPAPADDWTHPEIADDFAHLLRLRASVTEALEPLRAAGRIGKSLDAIVTLSLPQDHPAGPAASRHAALLAELFIVSAVELQPGAATAPVTAEPAADRGWIRCPRCWRWVPALVHHASGDVCPRCADALPA